LSASNQANEFQHEYFREGRKIDPHVFDDAFALFGRLIHDYLIQEYPEER